LWLGLALALTAGAVLDWPRAGGAWAAEAKPDDDDGGGAFLPTDRLKERQLDFARRLIGDARWSDAATLLDEILASDRDFFFKPDAKGGTWRSIKVEAGRLVQELPPEGHDAYALQFRARADKMLSEAVRQGDSQAVVAVARRWFHTPAGQKATVIAALEALEAGQPLAAAAWLDRLATAKAALWEPTLSIMRAVAWQRAGDEQTAVGILDAARRGAATTARIAGKDVAISSPLQDATAWLAALAGGPAAARPADEWLVHRGDAARNALIDASRPLLVPRYRVPLTRHPEEARWLEARRRLATDQDAPLLPAAVPLAVGGTVIVHTPMGLLAVDFATGKRLWLQTGGAAAPVLDTPPDAEDGGDDPLTVIRARTLAPVFDDATSGLLASDGRLVYAIESHPDALATRDPSTPRMQVFGAEPATGSWTAGNTLAAYDLAANGAAAWRLPGGPRPGTDKPIAPWFMGAPLPVGDQLFILVEEGGEVRLDVLDARSGSVLWTQPLAELDEDTKVDNPDSRERRVAGLSPALAEGVLVCPTGAGAVVAVDLATRTLLWAYNYAMVPTDDVVIMPNGVRVLRAGGLNGRLVIGGNAEPPGRRDTGRWAEATPILANGRAILAPGESDDLHCLDLRSGAVAWKRPRKEARTVAGVVDGSLIVVGRTTVEAVAIDTGRSEWSTAVAGEGHSVSGRAMLSNQRLFVPLDTPEVVEIDLATGRITGRSAGRGGAVPGNLIAYRGEVISQGVDSLDVFHQAAPLEARIETALAEPRGTDAEAWALMWRGHLALDRGQVETGIRDLRAAQAMAADRVPPDALADALVFAMERDAAVATAMWRDMPPPGAAPAVARRAVRAAIDGLIATREYARAWEACRTLIESRPDDGMDAVLIDDAADPDLAMTEARWIRGRLARLLAAAPAEQRLAIDADAERLLAAAGAADAAGANESLADFIEHFGRHPTAIRARKLLVERLQRQIAARSDAGPSRPLAAQRDMLLIELLHAGTAADRDDISPLLAAERRALGTPPQTDLGVAWPVGRVTVTRAGAATENGFRGPRVVPLTVTSGADSLLPGLRVAYDVQQQGLVVSDGFGRRFGGPLPIDEAQPWRRLGMGMGTMTASEAAVVGRVVVVRGAGETTAYELATPAGAGRPEGKHRRLWTAVDDRAVVQHAGVVRVTNRRFPRHGNVELGLRIHEPDAIDDDARGGSLADAGGFRATGVPVLMNRTLQLRDPASGEVLWERHRLDPDALIFGDDEFLCVSPRADGRKTLVLSMADGRVTRTCDLPGRSQRLLTHGRHVVTIQPRPGGGHLLADSVLLEIIDPVHDERIALGHFAGRARACPAGSDGLAVLEPSGTLTVIDLAARRIAFTTKLPDMPATFEQVRVIAWQDRYLVFVGRPETEAETRQLPRLGGVSPLPQLAVPGQPMTGSIWAVDRTSGDMLWPVPATLFRHCLHVHQPEELPLLVFVRMIDPQRMGDRARLSLLCLDKRTGHAVHVDDRLFVRQDMVMGCDIVGDAAAHAITIAPVGGGLPDLALRFTGEPIAPQPPFQAGEEQTVSGDFAAEVEYWFNRVITLPWPF